ncbi:flagellar hook basal-body protein [Methylobacterium organophilum]|nr:flagellar hook basal-body protein [Methylobacterium organophilum]
MGLFTALSNSISGASAQSLALNNISGNIANTQTVGFKSTETRFADMLAETGDSTQLAGGVLPSTRNSLNIQGTMQSTGVSTNLAISGNGYFIVKKNTGTPDSPAFGGDTGYTRRGDFAPDASGYLSNGAGYYLFAGPSATTPVQVPTGASTLASLAVSPAGLVLAQRLSEHLADIAIGADAETGLVADDFDELAHHLFDLRLLHVAHLRHGRTDALHFFRAEVAQHLGRVGLTQREQEDGGLVDLVELGLNSIVIHRR